MEVIASKKRRALTDVSNKGNDVGVKRKCPGPPGVVSKLTKPSVPTRKSTRTKKTSVDKLLPPIERLAVSQDESEVANIENKNEDTKEEEVVAEIKEEPLKWFDVDADTTCTYFIPEHVNDIFQFYKKREASFSVEDYMTIRKDDVSTAMRAVLVDWLVDVQQNFELNHESLYMAVKMFDLYLSRAHAPKNKIQLVGAAALNIACKYDERIPPVLDDFVYVCDDAYNRAEFKEMERSILRVLEFDIGFPLSYTFLRRYSQCSRTGSVTLTLARFLLEMSLLYYEFVRENESLMACTTLFLAMTMTKEGSWDDTMIHYTGYRPDQFRDVAITLINLLNSPPIQDTKSIKSKYSHRVYHEVSKTRLLSNEQVEELFADCKL